MRFLYETGIRLYALMLRVASPFHAKARDWVEGRGHLWKALPDVSGREVFWFHCASLGEFDQGLPVMNLLRERHPDAFILVTFFSPSGYNHYQKRKNPVDFACYIPLDTKKNAARFVSHFQPKAAFFIKYEFWGNHIARLKRSGAKLYSVSTSLRTSQHYFKWYGCYFRNILRQFDHFFAQNQATLDLLRSIGIHAVTLTGDTRFDRVLENKRALVKNERILDFIGESKSVFIAGSSWPKDEELLSELIHSNRFEKYIIAPHNVEKAHVDGLIDRLKVRAARYSEEGAIHSHVLVIDTIGQLASAYSYASIAYVGGGFSGNLHNILEPAVFGLPVIFGPKFSRFPEAQAFISEGIGFSVSTPSGLMETVDALIADLEAVSLKSTRFVEQNQGASEKVIRFVFG